MNNIDDHDTKMRYVTNPSFTNDYYNSFLNLKDNGFTKIIKPYQLSDYSHSLVCDYKKYHYNKNKRLDGFPFFYGCICRVDDKYDNNLGDFPQVYYDGVILSEINIRMEIAKECGVVVVTHHNHTYRDEKLFIGWYAGSVCFRKRDYGWEIIDREYDRHIGEGVVIARIKAGTLYSS